MTTIKNVHLASCETMDLSPETCWCLTNDASLRQQAEDYTGACASGVPGSADAVLDRKIDECNAYPIE